MQLLKNFMRFFQKKKEFNFNKNFDRKFTKL